MRHINVENFNPGREYRSRSRKLYKALRDCATSEERKTFVKNNTDWTKISKRLQFLGNHKCWFTEARSDVAPLTVEHFRPKKRINLIKNIDPCEQRCEEERTRQDKEGYWWLTYESSNFRIAGIDPNIIKGSYFPLMKGSSIGTPLTDNWTKESPILLDPCNSDDVRLLSFDGPIPVPLEVDKSSMEYKRAKVSIKVYNLDSDKLRTGRSVVFEKMQVAIKSVRSTYSLFIQIDRQNPLFRDSATSYADSLSVLLGFVDPRSTYIKMCQEHITALTDQWLADFERMARAEKYIK